MKTKVVVLLFVCFFGSALLIGIGWRGEWSDTHTEASLQQVCESSYNREDDRYMVKFHNFEQSVVIPDRLTGFDSPDEGRVFVVASRKAMFSDDRVVTDMQLYGKAPGTGEDVIIDEVDNPEPEEVPATPDAPNDVLYYAPESDTEQSPSPETDDGIRQKDPSDDIAEPVVMPDHAQELADWSDRCN